MKNRSKKLAVLSSIACIAITVVGCAKPAPTTPTPVPAPSADPGAILPPRGRPNLRMGLFEATPRADGSIKVDVEVANTGLGPARTNSVCRVVHIPPSGRANAVLDLRIPPIGAGRSAKATGVIAVGQVPFARNIILRARADANKNVDEGISGERDNFADTTFDYGPDLAVDNVTKAAASFKDPKNLLLTATVVNPGNVNTGAFTAVWEYKAKATPVGATDQKDVLLKWEPLEKQQVASIPPGKAAPDLRVQIDAARAKALELNGKNVVVRLVLDPDDTVRELSRLNNRGGAGHSFPPEELPDINVLGLLAWWTNQQPVLHLYPLIANTGDAECPPFKSQWFRLPGQGGGTGANGTGGSGDPAAPWEPLSPELQHTRILPMTWEFDARNNAKVPEFQWTPDVRDEGELVVLKFEADIGNKVAEFTDLPASATTPAPANPNQQPDTGTQAPTANTSATNGANNSFVWNFQVPRLPRADLSVRSLKASLSEDKKRIRIESAFSNQGSIHSGPFKLILNVDDRSIEIPSAGIPPTSRLYRLTGVVGVTNAMRAAGTATITVRLAGSKQEHNEKDNSRTRRIDVPRDRSPADIWVLEPQLRFARSGKDKENPNKIDQVVLRYALYNSGDEPTGPFSTNISIEGGPGAQIPDEDGIPGHTLSFRTSEPLDITSMAKPVGFTRVQARITVQAESDKNDSNNSNESNVLRLAPRPPDKPAGLPDLHVASIGLRPTSTAKDVHMKANIFNLGDADAPMFRVDWYVNEEYQRKEAGMDWAPGLQRGASIDNFDAVWCDYKPKPADGTKLRVMVVADPYNSIREEEKDESNDLDGELDINDKGNGPQIECQHHNAPVPATPAE